MLGTSFGLTGPEGAQGLPHQQSGALATRFIRCPAHNPYMGICWTCLGFSLFKALPCAWLFINTRESNMTHHLGQVRMTSASKISMPPFARVTRIDAPSPRGGRQDASAYTTTPGCGGPQRGLKSHGFTCLVLRLRSPPPHDGDSAGVAVWDGARLRPSCKTLPTPGLFWSMSLPFALLFLLYEHMCIFVCT